MGRRAETEGIVARVLTAFSAILCLLCGVILPVILPARAAYATEALSASRLKPIADIVGKAIQDGKTPGAVVLVGNHERVIYRRAFGYRALKPQKIPMTEDTVFDLASLTKVVATTTAVMQLAEKGKLDVEAPVVRYWPAFGANGKGEITVRQLLSHYSGLRPDLSLKPRWSGYKRAMTKIIAERPVLHPGTRFIYSDINFEVLGELVRRISGRPLDCYCSEHIFGLLRMKDSVFTPPLSLHNRIAPTWYHLRKVHRREAHDPWCNNMGGVAGHAGLFSTADDISIFAQMLLNGGSYQESQILAAETIDMMTEPQSPPGKKDLRGFGWALEAPFVSNREELVPAGAYGHLGYTGTALWIDPITDTYIIVLTNRVYPDGKGDIKDLRARIKKVVADAYGPLSVEQILRKRPSLATFYNDVKKRTPRNLHGKVMTGIDILAAENFFSLKGLRVGLITNHTGLDSRGQSTVDLLRNAPGVKLKAIFSPEHGLSGKHEGKMSERENPSAVTPVFNLYSNVTRPTEEMLKDLDALVFDIQDVGVRFYTYITTMGYAMEAAAKKGITFYVLDRPNPINASLVQGPVMDSEFKSFTGYFPLPLRHGMTAGELAGMFNAENKIGVKLHVIRMSGYRRSDWFDETGLQWINPSPNLRSLREAILYPAVAMVEGANVSVGRGTDTPFELLGAPWINASGLAAYLNGRNIRGVSFATADFVPKSGIYENETCHGVRVTLSDRQALDAAAMGIGIIEALYRLHPADFQLDKTLELVGSRGVLQAVEAGWDYQAIAHLWLNSLEHFLNLRTKYLLY